jgi:hypothetical protein
MLDEVGSTMDTLKIIIALTIKSLVQWKYCFLAPRASLNPIDTVIHRYFRVGQVLGYVKSWFYYYKLSLTVLYLKVINLPQRYGINHGRTRLSEY